MHKTFFFSVSLTISKQTVTDVPSNPYIYSVLGQFAEYSAKFWAEYRIQYRLVVKNLIF